MHLWHGIASTAVKRLHLSGVPVAPQQPEAWLPGIRLGVSGQKDFCPDVQTISEPTQVCGIDPHFTRTSAALAALCAAEASSFDLVNISLL